MWVGLQFRFFFCFNSKFSVCFFLLTFWTLIFFLLLKKFHHFLFSITEFSLKNKQILAFLDQIKKNYQHFINNNNKPCVCVCVFGVCFLHSCVCVFRHYLFRMFDSKSNVKIISHHQILQYFFQSTRIFERKNLQCKYLIFVRSFTNLDLKKENFCEKNTKKREPETHLNEQNLYPSANSYSK